MKSKLAIAVALASALHTSAAFSLGLGDIDVESNVNERLEAQIPLTNAGRLDASQILVSLASGADFARAGVARDYFLTSLDFEVTRGAGGPVLKVSSPDVVREPYLNFLVEVRWPNGRLVREYTVLLDLPTYSAAPVRAIAPAQPVGNDDGRGSRSVQRAPVASAAPAPRAAPSQPASRASNNVPAPRALDGQSVTVQANDTLWDIARSIRPADASINQTMVALQQLNPEAFINGNINLLKKGAVLRLPADSDVAAVGALAARQSVGAQTQDWRSGNPAAVDARPAPAVPEAPASQSGHLQLSAADTAQSSSDSASGSAPEAAADASAAASAGNAVQQAEINRLRNELAISLENLDKSAVENEEMEQRLDTVESQLSDLEALVTLKDRELESMRNALELRRAELESAEEAGQLAAETAQADVADAAGQVVDSDALASAAVTAPEAEAEIAAQAGEPATAAAEQATEAEAEQNILASIASALSISVEAVIGAAIGLLALIVAAIMWLVGRRQDEYQASVFEPEPAMEPAVAAVETDVAVDEPVAEPEAASAAPEEVVPEQPVAQAPVEPADDVEPAAAPVGEDSDEHDPLAEADIYLAYGRHEQALEMLGAAIAADGGNRELRLKLLEVHVDAGNQDGFRSACAELLEQDPAASEAADALLAGVSDASQWWPQGTVSAPADDFLESYSESSDELLGEVEIEPDPPLYSDDELKALAETSDVSDADLGLDLDLDSDEAAGSTGDSGEGDVGLQLAYDADASDAGTAASSEDEVSTKLDLARAYIDMGDVDGAREILDEVLEEGSAEQREQANSMLSRIA